MKRFLGNVSLVIGSLTVAVLAAEGLLRLTEQRYALAKVEFPDSYFMSDPVFGARHSFNRPHAEFRFPGPAFETFTNSLGCFDDEQTIAPGYVLVLGDSATWGYVPVEANWATELGRLTGRQVVKCGVTGIGTNYETALLEWLIKRIGAPPSMVILLYTMNDLNDDYVYPSYRVVDGQRLDAFRSLDLAPGSLDRYTDAELAAIYRESRPSMRQWLREHSLVAWIAYRAVFGTKRNALPPASISSRYEVELWELDDTGRPWLREARETHIRRLLALAERIHRSGAQFIVFDHDEGPHNEVLAARLPGHVDLYYQLTFDDADRESEGYFHRFDGHWNIDGNRKAAQEMFHAMRAAASLDQLAKPGQ
jgi:lysophospholipase L1-like esterase